MRLGFWTLQKRKTGKKRMGRLEKREWNGEDTTREEEKKEDSRKERREEGQKLRLILECV